MEPLVKIWALSTYSYAFLDPISVVLTLLCCHFTLQMEDDNSWLH